jgi:ribonucleoside-diphosphate reductase alpha chain
MSIGLPYDSDEGRAWAGAITALMTGHAYRTSAELAKVKGAHDGYAKNESAMLRVIGKHRAAVDEIDPRPVADDLMDAARTAWDEALSIGEEVGYRNAQASVLAPTGTIGLMMDCDTTGIEPDLGLVKMKKMVGGASIEIVNQTVPQALRHLGYAEEQVEAIVAYIAENKTIHGAPALRPEHTKVFQCAMGDDAIHYMGHVGMMAAAQPFLSGAVSKTVNLPEEATVEDIEELHLQAWKMGIKAIAIYRDNCKVAQPLSVSKKEKSPAEVAQAVTEAHVPMRRKLPKTRPSQTISFTVGEAKGYITAGEYPGDGIGELFVKLGKQGSTLSGLLDAFAISVSIGLQYGVPLESYVSKFMNMRFEPAGMTDDPEIRFATSILDYLARKVAIEYLPYEKREALGIFTLEERTRMLDEGSAEEPAVPTAPSPQAVAQAAPMPKLPGQLGAGRPRRADVLRVRHQDEARRRLPRLRVLRHHQRLQLMYSATCGLTARWRPRSSDGPTTPRSVSRVLSQRGRATDSTGWTGSTSHRMSSHSRASTSTTRRGTPAATTPRWWPTSASSDARASSSERWPAESQGASIVVALAPRAPVRLSSFDTAQLARPPTGSPSEVVAA